MTGHLTVIIPAYNEEGRLPLTLKDVLHYLEANQINSELIVVSDGSSDKTEEICRQNPKVTLLINPQNQGKGYSVRKGVLASRGDYLLFLDADNSTRISELDKFMPYLEHYDIIIGSRALPESKIIKRQFWLRESIGKLFNLVVQLFFLKGIKDTQCGFKLFKREAALETFKRAKINRFSFDVEILYLAKKLGYKIAEVPITWINSKPSRVSFLKDSLNIIADLVRIKLDR